MDGFAAVARKAWQYLPKPFGAKRTYGIVTSQIAMQIATNFANLTQMPAGVSMGGRIALDLPADEV